MKVRDNIKKCVAFAALQLANQEYMMVGTVFFIVRNSQKKQYLYAVTAKHVIQAIKDKGLDKLFIRVNFKNGQLGVYPTNTNEWVFHDDSSVDIAVHNFVFMEELDHLFYPESEFVTSEFINENELDVGDEVFIAGLFRHHHGTTKNLPIIRIGNIAAMVGEKIQTKEFLMDAYLIEARSIGGLSGSPVFTNLGIIRKFKGEIRQREGNDYHNLIGLIHGHYDTIFTQIDETNVDFIENGRVNTGIAIVTPISKLVEIFGQEQIKIYEDYVDKISAQQE
ncbi:MAG: hypothetical protein HYZ54_10990 [Ignavibacteriae bacterium]|nr:hypothetical protein [Ignavibacteriota bacterium]